MKKMIALLALAFFGVTATCGMSFAANSATSAPYAQEQHVKDPSMQTQKKHEKVKHEKKANNATKKHEKKADKKQEKAGMQQEAPAAAQE